MVYLGVVLLQVALFSSRNCVDGAEMYLLRRRFPALLS